MSKSPRGSRQMSRAALAGVFVVSLLAVGMTGAASASPRTAPTPVTAPPCTSGGLVVWLNTQPNGAAGTIYYRLEFSNLSGHTCTLRGYPGVSGISLGGTMLGSAAQRSSGTPVRTITLGIGRSATSALGIVEVGNFTSSSCHPTTAAGLRVYAPNQTAAKSIPFPFGACAKAGDLYLSVQAVKLS
jgi:Protein of unknown function (DUF4232)